MAINELKWRCRALIDADAWRHNLNLVKALHPKKKVMAVVKADAYGHGLENVLHALSEDVDAFAVASMQEAIDCRQKLPLSRVCLLSEFWYAQQIQIAQQKQIELVVWQAEQVAWLSAWQSKIKAHDADDLSVKIWLKVDTGMGRLGFLPDQFAPILQQVKSMPNVQICGIMTHFANADDIQDDYTLRQIKCFVDSAMDSRLPISLANSAALMAPTYAPSLEALNAVEHWLRPGIMLTGTSPFNNDFERQQINRIGQLTPVMTLQSRLLAVRRLAAGSAIGYGGHYITPEAMEVGVVGIGYGDGYPRVMSEQAYVLVNGHKAPIIGRISMDSLTIDLRKVPKANIGDVVTMWGKDLALELVAKWANTIPYELTCQLTPRVSREVC